MQTIFNLPDTIGEDLERFRRETQRFKDGAISAAEFRAFRVPQGVYEQRREGAFMLRVRLPAGGVLPHQMRSLAAAARQYGDGILHVTTRQDIQVHGVALDNVHPALIELHRAGLSTKGGGGNSVRNITACYGAGVCAEEAFDVTPYAIALTEFLLPDPFSYQLPRKYKIAFSGCARDCAGATVNDLGFIAKRRGDELGYAVYVGGGMGARSRVAHLLEEFVPADEIHLVAEAIKRVFDKHGNRKERRKARLRFLIEQLGLERLRALYEEELSQLRSAGLAALQAREFHRPRRGIREAEAAPSEGFAEWRQRNILSQKQDRYYIARVPLLLGDIAADTLEALADVVEAHAEGMARTTQRQNLVIRWVHEDELITLHRKLSHLALAKTSPAIVRNTVACTGAATCKLGICLSRGLAREIVAELDRSQLDLDELGELDVHISGCPNSCGRHPVGRIGFFGAARRVGGRLVPHYVFQVGGKVAEGMMKLAEGKDAIPARNIPRLVVEFLRAFQQSPEYPDYDRFLDADGRQVAEQIAAEHKRVPSFEEDKNYYYDWGAETPFTLAGRGPGECGAGVFDLIEVDLASAREALDEGKLFTASVSAARALLVTQGLEAKDDAGALALFEEHFLNAGLLDASLRGLIEKGRRSALTAEPEDAFDATASEVSSLVRAVRELYDGMDPSLRFRPVSKAEEGQGRSARSDGVEVNRKADFRGVACPLNYVKTKLLLDQMTSAQVLSVLVDSDGARNVPKSVQDDGHQVLSVTQEGDHWRIVVRVS